MNKALQYIAATSLSISGILFLMTVVGLPIMVQMMGMQIDHVFYIMGGSALIGGASFAALFWLVDNE